jgi:hypothetical protein
MCWDGFVKHQVGLDTSAAGRLVRLFDQIVAGGGGMAEQSEALRELGEAFDPSN